MVFMKISEWLLFMDLRNISLSYWAWSQSFSISYKASTERTVLLKSYKWHNWWVRSTSPVVYLLKDGNGGVVDASLVMLAVEEKNMNSWKRATFCQVCFNHFECGVTWFQSPLDHPKMKSAYSACESCLVDVDQSTLPEVSECYIQWTKNAISTIDVDMLRWNTLTDKPPCNLAS